MSKRKRLSYEQKLKACKLYESGNGSFQSISNAFNISLSGFEKMYFKYINFGPTALKMKSKNSVYTEEFKETVINEYKTNQFTYDELGLKYKIKNPTLITSWVLGYNKSNKTTYSGKGGVTVKGRKTTLDERIEIVKYLIDHELDYNTTSEKFKVSYQQVYQWYNKYLDKGIDGLIDNRGVKKKLDQLDELERLKREVESLKKELILSKAEAEVLKKNEELKEQTHLQNLGIKKNMKL